MSSGIVPVADGIRPFRIEVAEDDLVELRRRIAAVRLPSKELVAGRAAGDDPGAGPVLAERL
jgi:hypothetical protein